MFFFGGYKTKRTNVLIENTSKKGLCKHILRAIQIIIYVVNFGRWKIKLKEILRKVF